MIPLSHAIRLGATMKPQCYGRILSKDGDATCAIGAAIDAANLWNRSRAPTFEELHGGTGARGNVATRIIDLPANWMLTFGIWCSCPACDVPGNIAGLIPHLNDDHLWARERIADWVELHEGIPELERPSSTVEDRAIPVGGKT